VPKIKFTKLNLDYIPLSQDNQVIYWDSMLPGFGLCVGKQSKVFLVQGRLNGRIKKVRIGKYGIFTVDQARDEARKLLLAISKGQDPKHLEEIVTQQVITLERAFRDYLEARKSLKPRTIKDYKTVMNSYLGDWQKKPITDITKDMVVKRHSSLGKRSHVRANMAMRVLRAILNFAMEQYEDSQGNPIISINPVTRLSKTRAWYRVERRRSVIKTHELPVFFEAIDKLKKVDRDPCSVTIRDYLLFLLFTGMRPGEARRLNWEDVDFKSKTFILPDSKNKDPYALPLTDYIYDLLQGLWNARQNEYVFPGKNGIGHIVEPKRQVAKILKISQISFMLTDLRRTFITIAESLDLSYYAVKRLLNHKIKGDVTAGYIVVDVKRLRKPMQQITDYILNEAGVKLKTPARDT
jgi:integrase